MHSKQLTFPALSRLFQALQKTKYEDWYWKFQVGKCYYRLGMFRDAEKMFKSALKQQEMIDVFLHLSRVRTKTLALDVILILPRG